MKRNILYVDSNSYGHFHETFNSASLKSFALISEKIKYYAHRTSKENVVKILEETIPNLEYHSLYFPNENSKTKYLFKLLLTAIYNIYFVIKLDKNDVLVFNFNNLVALKLINFLNKYFKSNIIVICHGEMQALLPSNKSRFSKKILSSFFMNDRLVISENLYFMVLSQSVYFNLLNILTSEKSSHIVFTEHPYIFKKHHEIKTNCNVLRIGTIGTMAISKGLDDLIFLEKSLKENTQVELSIIGTFYDGFDKLQNSKIHYYSSTNRKAQLMDRNLMNSKIKELDYALFLYPNENYKLIASGAIFDAIDNNIPIIAYKIDYFLHLEKEYGSIGYLVNNKYELINLIKNISETSSVVLNYDIIKKELSPEKVSEQIITIIDRIFIN